VDWVEFDVKVLTDGEMVSMHDGTVDRTTDGSGDITKMTYIEVAQLNAGKGFDFGFVPVPKVEEILQILAESPKFVRAEMHIHNLYEPEPLVELLKKYRVQDRCYFNFNGVIFAEHLREDLGDSESLVSLNWGPETGDGAEICNRLQVAYLCIPKNNLNLEYVDRVHQYREENPVFIHCYPVQTEAEWQEMLDIGVDVIQTDYPEALFEFLEAQGFTQ